MALNITAAGNGPAVLLIHGLGADRQDWQAVADQLQEQFSVLLIDLPGQGESCDEPLPASLGELATRIWRELNHRGIERLSIAGHSLGGALAQEMAHQAPQRCDGLIVCNSLTRFVPDTLRGHLELLVRQLTAVLLGPAWTARLGAWRMFPGPNQAAHRAMVIDRGRRNSRRSYLRYLRLLTGWSVSPASLTMPVLWLASGLDYFPLARVRAEVAALPDAGLTVYEDAGHGLPMQYPARVAEAITAFLAPAADHAAAAVPAAAAAPGS